VNHLKKFQNQISLITTSFYLLSLAGVAGLTWYISRSNLPILFMIAVVVAFIILASWLFSYLTLALALKPLQMIWSAILHVAPEHNSVAPNLNDIKIGREMVESLTLQIYQFASQQDNEQLVQHRDSLVQASSVLSHMPLPIFVFNKQQLVTNASLKALEYCRIESSQLFGKPLFENLLLEFPNELTLESWLADVQDNKLTDSAYWERVRVRFKADNSLLHQCDVAAFYNRDNPSGTEVIVTLFDRTTQYNQDDQAMSFIALAVHELRTPLTILRGYIEVFEEELGDKLDDEMRGFMHKMQASANQLTSFVHNILNVARLEDDQLALHLSEENWQETVNEGIENMLLRAKILDKNITCEIEPNLPTVGIDKTSMYEVLNNILDNALKYSGETNDITLKTYKNSDGLIETTITDHGVGIPSSVLPNLFEKFYRNHRTRTQIGGTGLGLYLSKAIVTAHGGQIWASSKVDQGSTFGFTILPYDRLSSEMKAGDSDIVRQPHGWIKNHSLYRR